MLLQQYMIEDYFNSSFTEQQPPKKILLEIP